MLKLACFWQHSKRDNAATQWCRKCTCIPLVRKNGGTSQHLTMHDFLNISVITHTCTSANTVFEANAKKSMWEPCFQIITRPKPRNGFWCRFRYTTTSTGNPVQNLVEIDSAVMILRMCEMSCVCVDFCCWYISINPSIHPFLFHCYRSQFWGDLNAEWFRQHVFTAIGAFGDLVDTSAHLSKPPKPQFWGHK